VTSAKEQRRSSESAKGPKDVPVLIRFKAVRRSSSLGKSWHQGKGAWHWDRLLEYGLEATDLGYNFCLTASMVASVFIAMGNEWLRC